MAKRSEVVARLSSRLDKSGKCWTWSGATRNGYGRISIDNKLRDTHIVAYKLWVGPIPKGWEVDHTCLNRRCCNPKHLEAVPKLTNIRRAKGWYQTVDGTWFCSEDHEQPFDSSGGCKECRRAGERVRYTRHDRQKKYK